MTELDDGAYRNAPPTVPDIGRGEVALPPEDGLPPELQLRFDVGRELHGDGSEAAVYLVTERETGNIRVVRLYRESRRDEHVARFLLDHETRHVVRVFECDVVSRYAYEVMEYLPGGDLLDLRGQHPSGVGAEQLTSLVRQVAEALEELHAAKLLHRDVKPATRVVRNGETFEVALIDFGIAEYRAVEDFVPRGAGTPRFMPPEYSLNGGQVSTAVDWWALGMTVLELAIGHEWLEGLPPERFPMELTQGAVSVEDVADPRIRLLCRGLLTSAIIRRWGADEVRRWLAGESPSVDEGLQPLFPRESSLPFHCLGRDYFNRRELAFDLTRQWEAAAHELFSGGRRRSQLRRLAEWIRDYPRPEDAEEERLDAGDGPADVRLLRVIRQLDATQPPIYRGLNISPRNLPQFARTAVGGGEPMPEIIEQIFEHGLLTPLAAAPALPDGDEPGLGGGDGLDTVDRRWRERHARWRDLVATIGDPDAKALLSCDDPGTRRRALAITLWMAVADDAVRDEVRRTVQGHARVIRPEPPGRRTDRDWYVKLAGDPDGMWAALLLQGHVRAQAEEAQAAWDRAIWLARNEALLEWLRKQGRPPALGWAVVGIGILSALCAGMVGGGDMAGRVPVSAITDAWIAAAFAIAASLGVEGVLAWEAGGRYHPRYSLLGASLIVLARALRPAAAQRLLRPICAVGLGVLSALSVFVPVATPLAVGVAVPVWAVYRLGRWYRDRGAERAEIRNAELAGVGPDTESGPSEH
jgi:serine/threonine protein kinase